MSGASPGDLVGQVWGVDFGEKFKENVAENLPPDCLQVPNKAHDQ